MKAKYFIIDHRQNSRGVICPDKDYYYSLLKIISNQDINKEDYPYRGDFVAYNRSTNHSEPWKRYLSKGSISSVFMAGDSNSEFSLEWYLSRNEAVEIEEPQELRLITTKEVIKEKK